MSVRVTYFECFFSRLIPPEKGSGETAWRREIEYKGGSDMVNLRHHRGYSLVTRLELFVLELKEPLLGHPFFVVTFP